MSKRFVITGGHHNSALVVAKELVAAGYQVEWIGHRHAAEGDQNDSAEYVEVTAAGLPFHELRAGKSSWQISNFVKVFRGLADSYRLLSVIKPDAVISFGGYLGLSVSVAGFARRVPVFLHEQTAAAGKANLFVARFARRVYLTWPDSARYYPAGKSLLVGLPLRPGFLDAKAGKFFENSLPSVLIMGGKQGSHTINEAVFAALPELLKICNVIHQTGTSSATGDYERALSLKKDLGNLASRYDPRGYIGENEIASVMKSVTLVAGRSGAHTAYELGFLGKKAVLIPFPYTFAAEQSQNARILEEASLAEVIPQSELSPDKLVAAIVRRMGAINPAPLPLPANAATVLVADLLSRL